MEKQEFLATLVGLSRNPRPIVKRVHELYKKMWIDGIKFGNTDSEWLEKLGNQGKTIKDPKLFISLYDESTIELPGSWDHNGHWNLYGGTDHPSPVYFPSKLYIFSNIDENAVGDIEQRQQEANAEIPECAMKINFNEADSTARSIKRVLSLCRKISEQQQVTDWLLENVQCETLTEADAPMLCSNVQSVSLLDCKVPRCFVRCILRQLFDSATLLTIRFQNTNVHEYENDLDELMENLSALCLEQSRKLRLSLAGSEVSPKFISKWNRPLKETGVMFYF